MTAIALSLALLAPADLLAEPRPLRRQALSLRPLALISRGVGLQYERYFVPSWHVSLAAGVGIRASWSDTQRSAMLGGGLELRWWPWARELWWHRGGPGMVGPFFGLRFDAGRGSLTERATGRRIGNTVTLTETLSAGYRVLFWERLEVTPWAGAALRTEPDPDNHLAPWTRLRFAFGLTVGAPF